MAVLVGARSGPVFRPVDCWGNIAARPLSTRTVGNVVTVRHQQAGVAPMFTHDIRRTWVGNFLDSGADVVQA